MKIHKASLIGYIAILIGSLFEVIPLTYACIVMTVAMAVSIISVFRPKSFPLDFIALLLAAISMGIATVILSPEWTLPYMGSFFYGSFALAHLSSLFLYRDKENTVLDSIASILFLVGLGLSIFLFPDPKYLWLPPLVSVVPVLILAKRMKKQEQVPPVKTSLFSIPNVVTLLSFSGLFFAGTLLITPKAIIELSPQVAESIKQLEFRYQQDKDPATAFEIAKLYFFNDKEIKAEPWFEASAPKYPLQSKAYLATILGIKARDGGSPIERIHWVKESITILDSLVDLHPNDIELRIIRASYYVALPTNFKMLPTSHADAQFILSSNLADSTDKASAQRLLEPNKDQVQ